MLRRCGLLILTIFLFSCGEKEEDALFVDVVPADTHVNFGISHSCSGSETGYYIPFRSVRIRWTSTKATLTPLGVRFTMTLPGYGEIQCSLDSENALSLFGLSDGLPPTTPSDICEDGTPNCVEIASDVSGLCDFACTNLPIDASTPNFLTSGTLEVTGALFDEASGKGRSVRAQKKVKVRFAR